MAGYLLDSNHLGQAVTRTSTVRERLEEIRKSGERFGTCVPALCEIEAGVRQVSHPEEYRLNLKRLLRHVRVWPLDLETARIYGEIYGTLRAKGRVLSQVDIMLAALARQMRLTLLTTDRDFEALPEIRTENWVETED
ncbi:MAG: type II toxin-antitoxin system VapC family toxin [bacterium]|nr:type II toxin-antitoxin system VapC family toxin [bacterium]